MMISKVVIIILLIFSSFKQLYILYLQLLNKYLNLNNIVKLTKMNITNATKNFIPKTIGTTLLSAAISSLATMGGITFAKIYQKNKEIKKSNNQNN